MLVTSFFKTNSQNLGVEFWGEGQKNPLEIAYKTSERIWKKSRFH